MGCTGRDQALRGNATARCAAVDPVLAEEAEMARKR